VFVEVLTPPHRCFIVGAVHIAQPLAKMLVMSDYAVTVIDPRESFATEARFPGIEMTSEWPDEALERLKPDRGSAVVALTHDPKLDDPALAAALRSDCFYIGALGSRRNHAGRCARLKEQGFTDSDVARIRGPVGLSIGAISPAEVAISIVAQMTQILRRGERARMCRSSLADAARYMRDDNYPCDITCDQSHCRTAAEFPCHSAADGADSAAERLGRDRI
jgi:xanthine dehydrogenase accessory factor